MRIKEEVMNITKKEGKIKTTDKGWKDQRLYCTTKKQDKENNTLRWPNTQHSNGT